MRASDVGRLANELTDENHDFNTLLGFVNAGISEINSELNSNFPRLTMDGDLAFPDTWSDLVLVPFVGAKIKQKDSSQFEYMDLFGQFKEGLSKMKAKYTVPDDYKGEDTDSLVPDYTGHYNNW